MNSPSPESVLNEFLKIYVEDQNLGRSFDLDYYLDLFPGQAEILAPEYLLLKSEADAGTEGQERIGDYHLHRELGRGGQGVVYLAKDSRLNRNIALKVLHSGAGISASALERFRREAEVTARLDHPCICTVYDTGTHGGQAFIAMSYIEGLSLVDWAAENPVTDKASLNDALDMFEKVASGLHSAHEAGVVHRDIKPANIIVTAEGNPVITDFGLAQMENESLPTLTRSGDLLGTPAYMSPEQIVREQTGIDRRTDVYSLGVTMFEFLSGRRLYDAPTREGTYHAILTETPPLLRRLNPSIPRDLETIVALALEKDRSRRYQTAEALAFDLGRVKSGDPISARPPGAIAKLMRWRRRNPVVAGLVLLIVIATVAVVVEVLVRNRELRFLRDDAIANATLADTERSRAEDLLVGYQRLADVRSLRRLKREEEELWPIVPRLVPAMDQWLQSLGEILARRQVHSDDLAALGALPPETRSNETSWRMEILRELVDGLEAATTSETGLKDKMELRRGFAQSMSKLSIEDHLKTWSRLASHVESDPRFANLKLKPQMGLVPIGLDPQSGFPEFCLLATHQGPLPERDANGVLKITKKTGLIFVLLPGGEVVLGTDGDKPGGRNPDPDSSALERPAHSLTLDPFLISKYELTQAQWFRFFGANPSNFHAGGSFGGRPITALHPVTNISWNSARKYLPFMGTKIPTEAQWEYACRAGTNTPLFCGLQDFPKYGNTADADFRVLFPRGAADESLSDGHAIHAPVGSYRANGFGLYDMHGNVFEWCRDGLSQYADSPARRGDGFRESKRSKILRGGGFKMPHLWARSTARAFNNPSVATSVIGLRPMISLDQELQR